MIDCREFEQLETGDLVFIPSNTIMYFVDNKDKEEKLRYKYFSTPVIAVLKEKTGSKIKSHQSSYNFLQVFYQNRIYLVYSEHAYVLNNKQQSS